MIVKNNIEALNISRNLKNNFFTKDKATTRLSSGYKINRAADNAAGLLISEGMRAQIRGLHRGSQNIQEGICFANTADGALQEIQSILQRERELMVQAANDTNCYDDRTAIEKEINQLTSELDRLFDSTEFNTIKIFKGNNKYLSGPDTVSNINKYADEVTEDETIEQTIIWIPKEDIDKYGEPKNEQSSQTTVTTKTNSKYSEYEYEVPDPYDPLHPTCKSVSNYYTDTTTTTEQIEKSVEYERIGESTQHDVLKNPADIIPTNGYIDVANAINNTKLSCDMSQLGVIIDGQLIDIDLYNSHSPDITTTTKIDPDGVVHTKYSYKDIIDIEQKIELVNDGKAYNISYALYNKDKNNNHNVSLRLALDAMNLDSNNLINTNDNIAGSTIKLENTESSILVSIPGKGDGQSDLTDACLTDISSLYGFMDKSGVNMSQTGISHTGFGFWWNDKEINAGGSIALSSILYSLDETKMVAFSKTERNYKKSIVSRETMNSVTESEYKPGCLHIQAGANTGQLIAVRLWNLSADRLRITNPDNVSAFHPQESFEHIDRVIKKMTDIRSYYGAITNRLEHAYMNNDNTAENLTAAESRIRDADMAEEMIQFSMSNIIQQAGQSVLTQANQSKEGVLALF